MWQEDGGNMLIILGYVHIQPSVLGQFMNEIGLLAESVRRRDGNISYNIAVEDNLAGKILIAERWKNHVALSAHLESADTVAFIERWQNSMTGDVLKYDAVNERGLTELT
ncbi:Quinol monooxygenase YgiN [Kosakonia oryzendophytica]|uniref:Quinol monooxygenase YgiN n=2 Tax=Kosakonia oryzendophytica TaxID=1005665 RepID=A0A1C4CMT2_9ENTR|nr:Quinol monooxygenase YgiN [Kosakonia oryzendophytica]